MKKKLITMLAMLAIVSSFVMAAQKVVGSEDDLTDFSSSLAISGGDATHVIADAENVDFIFTIEAQNGSTWVDANDETVYDAAWDVREGFDVNFRLKATEGSSNDATSIKVKVTVGNLFRDGAKDTTFSNYHNAGPGTLSTLGSFSGFEDVSLDPGRTGYIYFDTKANRFYSTDPGTIIFSLNYVGDEDAPAGRYESDVSINYYVI